jgi:hypothetical protein
MPEILDQRTKDILKQYFRQLKSLPNESAKRARFAALIAELFPGSNAITEYARGVEKLIRIQQPTGVKRGRADAYYGNAIIEFDQAPSKYQGQVPPLGEVSRGMGIVHRQVSETVPGVRRVKINFHSPTK